MRHYKVTVRPLKPEWFAGEDLDSLARTRVFSFKKYIELVGYLQGWIDAGYIIISIEFFKWCES